MKILVTGANGFLGRYAAKEFKEQGHIITGMGHGKWYADEYSKWGLDNWVESTITFEALININEVFDIIVHCGGSGSVYYSTINPYEDFQKTVQSTLAVLEYIRLKSPSCKLVYPSSVAVQGNLPDIQITEDMHASPISPYGFHKKIAEELCKSYHINYDITVGIIRFFSVYGPGLQKQLLYDACKKIDSDEVKEVMFFGTGKETRDWIYITDAASLIYNVALDVKGIDFINGGGGERVEICDVLQLLREEFGAKSNITFNGKIREGDPRFFWSDNSKARKYGWDISTPLPEGIRSYVEYYKSLKK